MLIKSNKGNYCIPTLRNSINDQNIDDIGLKSYLIKSCLNYFQISPLLFFSYYLPYFFVFYTKTNNITHEIHITENEIIDVIQIQDPNKATGPDKISNKMLKISPIFIQ
jgi:hypothetical protein